MHGTDAAETVWVTGLEDGDLMTSCSQSSGGGKSAETCSDDDSVVTHDELL